MDAFTKQHLEKWIDGYDDGERREYVLTLITDFVAEYPDTLARLSWPEILSLAERRI